MDEITWRKACKAKDTLYTVVVIDPIVRRVFPAILASRITPNQVTIFRFLLSAGIFAAFLNGSGVLAGVGFLLWYFLDCIDGKVARFTGLASPFGDWLDRTTDRIGMGLILSGEGLYLQSLGQGKALSWCLLFLSVWLLGIANGMLLVQLRQKLAGALSADPSEGAPADGAFGIYETWKTRLRKNRIEASLLDDVEWLHLGVLGGGFTGEVKYIIAAIVLMAMQKVVESSVFMVKRYRLLADTKQE